MPVKFLELTDDPYTNKSNLFILVLSMYSHPIPDPTTPGSNNASSGYVNDPNGQTIDSMWIAFYQDYEVTGTLSDEAFAHSWTRQAQGMLVPPGFSFNSFVRAIALQGTLEELSPFIRGV